MEYELYHYGVKGMKWGVRKKNPYKARTVRGHAGPGRYVGSNERRLEKAKSDLNRLDNGEHLSIGVTKKRQAALDNRDRTSLEKKISKLKNKTTIPTRLEYPKKSSSTTRKVIDDYNTLSNQEFINKYATSKKVYAKRIAKYGDPFMNAPLARIGKNIASANNARLQRSNNTIQKEIDSFKGYENGIRDKKGRTILSKDDVASIVSALEQRQIKNKSMMTAVEHGKIYVNTLRGFDNED